MSQSPQSTQAAQSQSPSASQQPATSNGDTNTANASESPDMDQDGYPPQKHAGQVGLGPEYGKANQPSGGEKLSGWKEQIAGKLTGNHEKYQHGKDLRTGELKKKQNKEDNNPFTKADDEKDKSGGEGRISSSPSVDSQEAQTPPPVPSKNDSERGAEEEAATTAPEGTDEAEVQKRGEKTREDKQIG